MGDNQPNDRRNWATLLRSVRKEKGWTQGELADAAGVSRSTIIRQEGNEVLPDRETLKKIVHALGNVRLVDAEAVVHDEPQDVPMPAPLPREVRRLLDLYDRAPAGEQQVLLERVAWVVEWFEARLFRVESEAKARKRVS